MMRKVLAFCLPIVFTAGFFVCCKSKSKEESAPVDVIPVTGVSLDKTELNLNLTDNVSETLVAVVTPDNATNKKVFWSSSDENTATVDENGKVEAKAAGTATITATTEDGGKTAQCSVGVNSGCFAEGTLITLEDGSKKTVENLKRGERVLTFNHETGLMSNAKIVDYYLYTENSSGVMTLHFSDNIDVTVVTGHAFYDKDERKYVQITVKNVDKYINHKFFCAEDMSWKSLTGYTLSDEKKDSYVVVTENHLNCVADGMLSNEDHIYYLLANVFEFDDNMKIIQEKKNKDIQTYGLWTYDDIEYLTQEAFDGLNLKYLGILVAKGFLTREIIDYMCANVSAFDPDIVEP